MKPILFKLHLRRPPFPCKPDCHHLPLPAGFDFAFGRGGCKVCKASRERGSTVGHLDALKDSGANVICSVESRRTFLSPLRLAACAASVSSSSYSTIDLLSPNAIASSPSPQFSHWYVSLIHTFSSPVSQSSRFGRWNGLPNSLGAHLSVPTHGNHPPLPLFSWTLDSTISQ